MNLQELTQLKSKMEKAKSDYDMALGSLESSKDSIRELGFGSMKELRDAMDALKSSIDSKTEEAETALAQWKETYAGLL